MRSWELFFQIVPGPAGANDPGNNFKITFSVEILEKGFLNILNFF